MPQLTSFPADLYSAVDKLSGNGTAWHSLMCTADQDLCSSGIGKSNTFGKMRQIDSVSTLAPDDDDELEDLDEVEEFQAFDGSEVSEDVVALNDDEVTEAFKALNKKGNGLVMLSDVRRMLLEAGADLTDDEFDDAFHDMFADCNVQIDIKLFGASFLQEECAASEDVSICAPHLTASIESRRSASDAAHDTGCFAGVRRAARFFF